MDDASAILISRGCVTCSRQRHPAFSRQASSELDVLELPAGGIVASDATDRHASLTLDPLK